MKKWIAGISLVLIALLLAVYFLIPNVIKVDRRLTVAINYGGLYRNLAEADKWKNWWPGENNKDASGDHLTYNGFEYRLVDVQTFSFPIAISGKGTASQSALTVVNTEPDSVSLGWQVRIPTSYNPFKRLSIYFNHRGIETDMDSILKKMVSFYSVTRNMYDFDIQKKFVVDSSLVSTASTSAGYPSVQFIYGLIGQLKTYIASQSANESGFPMLNIHTADSITYTTKVAIPVDQKLSDAGNISYKWMLPGGKILVTEVAGGPAAIDKAFIQIEKYMTDHKRVAPAIPFLSLVTDRLREPDSSKWVTRIYYPVM